MFKKFRNNKDQCISPSAPTTEEILSDLETFQVHCHTRQKYSEDAMDSWWNAFESFMISHNRLQNMGNDIYNTTQKLEKYKHELETTTRAMDKEIKTQKEVANIE